MMLNSEQRAEVKTVMDMLSLYHDAVFKEARATEPHYAMSVFIAQDLQAAIEKLIAERDDMAQQAQTFREIADFESHHANQYFGACKDLEAELRRVYTRIAELMNPTYVFKVTPEEMERVKERTQSCQS